MTKFEHFDNIPSNLFKETVNTILEKHAPTKKKHVRANQVPFITKTLSKEIMKRSQQTNFLTQKVILIEKYITNSVTILLVSSGKKKDFYGNLDISKVTDYSFLENC